MSQPLLTFDAVTLHRGGKRLFDNLSFAVHAGEGLHLSGANGVGKSSLLRLAAGLLRETSGQVQRALLAFADDNTVLDAELPLARALAFWSRSSQGGAKLADALEALDLTNLADLPVRLLSSGQAKRATLARVAASDAALWLLDEPLNGLDAASIDRLNRLIAAHRANGGAVVAASHAPFAGEWMRLELGA